MTQGTTSCPKWPGRFTARHHRAARAVNTSMNYEEQGKRMVMMVMVEVRQDSGDKEV